MKREIILFVLFFCFYSFSYSQNKTDNKYDLLLNLTLEDLMNIDITSVSKKSENVLEAPQTVIVITEEDITNRGYIDLEQLFHDLPGFDISRGNGTGYSNIYQRGYRSNNTDRTLMLVDGVEENDLWSGNIWLDRQYPLSNIKRVEVVYGPSSTIYGANAFLGVINVITKNPDEIIKTDKNFGISGQVNTGTWNTRYIDVTSSGKYKDLSLTLTGRYFKSDEMDLSKYDDWDYDLTNYDIGYYLKKLKISDSSLAKKAKDYDAIAYYKDKNLNGLKPQFSNQTEDWLMYGKIKNGDFTLGFQSWVRNHGYGAWYRDDYELGPENGGKWVANNSFIYANYEKKISDQLTLSSYTRGKIHKLDDACEEYYYKGYLNGVLQLDNLLEKKDTEIIYNNSLHKIDTIIKTKNPVPYWFHEWSSTYSQQISTELKALYEYSKVFNILFGTELRYSHTQGQYIQSNIPDPSETGTSPVIPGGNHFYSTDIGIYTQASIKPISYVNIVFGGRLDNNKIRQNGGYGTVFNPKAALIFTPQDFIIKVLYSEAYKDAGFWTKYGTTPSRQLTNPNLEPEKVKNIELSFAYKISKYFYADISAYNANYSRIVSTAIVDYIDEQGNKTTTQQHQALGSLKIKGIQSSLNFKYKNYSSYFNYTFTSPYTDSDSNDVRIGDIASHSFNLGINAKYFNRLNLNLRTNFVGEKLTGKKTTVNNNPLNKIDSYLILNSSVTYDIIDGLSVQLVCNNILNKEYFDPGVRSAEGDYYASKMPQNERNFMLKIIFKY